MERAGVATMGQEGGVEAFGEQLRRERETRGVALEAICTATKVPVKHIQALEAGAFANLPGGVIRRGFLRSYLGALGLEERLWLARFDESCRRSGLLEPADLPWGAFAENVRNRRGARRRRARLRSVLAVVLAGMLALAGWAGWRLATHRALVPYRAVWGGLKSWVDNAASR
jgi:cytoskeletal protein RodZ